MDRFLSKLGHHIDNACGFVATMDTTAWAVLSVSSVVAGYMLLRGNTIKGS